MPTLTMPKLMQKLNVPQLPTLPKIDAEELFDRADAFQTRALAVAERFSALAIKRIPAAAIPMSDRFAAIQTVQAEFFNRANKVHSANRVFVKRVFLGETAPTAAPAVVAVKPVATVVVKPVAQPAATVTASPVANPVAKPVAKPAAKVAVKTGAKGSVKPATKVVAKTSAKVAAKK